MAPSPKLTSLLCVIFFIIIVNVSIFSPQTKARNIQGFTQLNGQNPNGSMKATEEDDQDPVFVRQTGNGYGLYPHYSFSNDGSDVEGNPHEDNGQVFEP
ncbi:PREDICTED: uncharacterized protein LOC104798402 [Tarenaya hassleriana]|uniref:uncharacterized protein LOC104798402 n=1 Tax=Tarenaya hassleriana TaxID=28532 RepID=UPI00053C2264|nr:PREDICTED: uncharacterized protein LOC104798402 [Tarenaya hassleriana]